MQRVQRRRWRDESSFFAGTADGANRAGRARNGDRRRRSSDRLPSSTPNRHKKLVIMRRDLHAPSNVERPRSIGVADGAGVVGALFAALCCAGIPVLVGGLSAVGLSFLRTDSILLPLLVTSLVLALWGLMRGRDVHGTAGPFLLGALAGLSLLLAVRGFHWLLWPATIALLLALAWNILWRRRLRDPRPAPHQ
jgi:mercuric ion transport protein